MIGDDVTGVQGLVVVADLLLFYEEEALTLDLHVVVLLLRGTLTEAAPPADTAFRRGVLVAVADGLGVPVGRSRPRVGDVLALLLLLLLSLLRPDLVHVEEFDGDKIALEGSVAILAAADKDVGIQEAVLGRDVGVATVLLVHTQNSRDELPVAEKRRQGGLW